MGLFRSCRVEKEGLRAPISRSSEIPPLIRQSLAVLAILFEAKKKDPPIIAAGSVSLKIFGALSDIQQYFCNSPGRFLDKATSQSDFPGFRHLR